MKNSYIFDENEKLGRILIVEGDENTSNIHRIKIETKPICSLASPWWDKDGIANELSEREDEIKSKLVFHEINGAITKLTDASEIIAKTLPKEKAKVCADKLTEIISMIGGF